MKNLITAAALVAISSSAMADGFYQQVVGQNPGTEQAYSINPDSNYGLFYETVTSHHADFIAEQGRLVEQFSYTPLYLKVTGQSEDRVAKIADNDPQLEQGNI